MFPRSISISYESICQDAVNEYRSLVDSKRWGPGGSQKHDEPTLPKAYAAEITKTIQNALRQKEFSQISSPTSTASTSTPSGMKNIIIINVVKEVILRKIVQTKVKIHNLMTKERNGIYNHQQITKNISKEMVEPIHGVQNVMLGGSMMPQHMMNGLNAKRQGKQRKRMSLLTLLIVQTPHHLLQSLLRLLKKMMPMILISFLLMVLSQICDS